MKDLEESKEMKAIQQLMLTAQQLQSRLKKLWEIRNMVERMDQRTLAEIKSRMLVNMLYNQGCL